ncbi:MAG TPA: helix-turn-helix domain-containing protein [Bryobacteraceae bacterium]|nr:helix-turn-helix domain-containing protein [Bryobacteraceae bacterium]
MSAGEEKGRFRQRAHTRALLVKTASERIQSGEIPTVTAVAEAAQVSRRTAYRYFPSQEQLLAEAAIESAKPLVSNTEFPEDLRDRIRVLVATVQRFVYHNQGALRTIVRLTAEHVPSNDVVGAEDFMPVRRNRIDWIRTALAPARKRLGGKRFGRLASALSLCVGIESVMVLTNLWGLSQKEATRVSIWAAETLVAGALEQAEQEVAARPKRKKES